MSSKRQCRECSFQYIHKARSHSKLIYLPNLNRKAAQDAIPKSSLEEQAEIITARYGEAIVETSGMQPPFQLTIQSK